MQDWSKSLPSLSGSTAQAPKAPVQQMLGTPGRGHIVSGKGREMFQPCCHLTAALPAQLRQSSGKGALWNHSCALTLRAGAGSNTKHRNSGAKKYRNNTSADAGDWASFVSQTAPHQYKNKDSSSTEITFKSCK